MKTKEEYAEGYINYLYRDVLEHDKEIYAPDIQQTKADFKAGFDLAEELFKPKWISAETPPDDERTVLVWINNTENPQWNNYRLGSYLNEKWYCVGGRKSHEIVTDWSNIPTPKNKNR